MRKRNQRRCGGLRVLRATGGGSESRGAKAGRAEYGFCGVGLFLPVDRTDLVLVLEERNAFKSEVGGKGRVDRRYRQRGVLSHFCDFLGKFNGVACGGSPLGYGVMLNGKNEKISCLPVWWQDIFYAKTENAVGQEKCSRKVDFGFRGVI